MQSISKKSNGKATMMLHMKRRDIIAGLNVPGEEGEGESVYEGGGGAGTVKRTRKQERTPRTLN